MSGTRNLLRLLLAFAIVGIASPAAGEALRLVADKAQGGESLHLLLSAEIAASWQDANVGRATVRSIDGQKSLASEMFGKSLTLDLPTVEDGCSLVIIAVGNAGDKGHADSWRRVSHGAKIIACRDAVEPGAAYAARLASGPVVTSKAGGPIELRPLMSPAMLRPGSDLPIRVYLDDSARPHATLVATDRHGDTHTAISDRTGLAVLRLPTSGRWTVRYSDQLDGRELETTLIFNVAAAKFWQAIDAWR